MSMIWNGRGWSAKNAQGGRVGEKYDPFQRVGIYIPGGTAPGTKAARCSFHTGLPPR